LLADERARNCGDLRSASVSGHTKVGKADYNDPAHLRTILLAHYKIVVRVTSARMIART